MQVPEILNTDLKKWVELFHPFFYPASIVIRDSIPAIPDKCEK